MVHPCPKGYQIDFSRDVLKYLGSIDKSLSQKIIKKVSELSDCVENLNIKKLKSKSYDLYRLRVGDIRVVYSIEHKRITICVVAVGPRKDIYNKIKSLLG